MRDDSTTENNSNHKVTIAGKVERLDGNIMVVHFEAELPSTSSRLLLEQEVPRFHSLNIDTPGSLEEKERQKEKRRLAELHPKGAPRHIRREGIKSFKKHKCPHCGCKMMNRYCTQCKKEQPKIKRIY